MERLNRSSVALAACSRPFVVHACRARSAKLARSHYRKAEPWSLRFLIERLLWQRNRALPNVLERDQLVLPARLEIPVGEIRARPPIPFEPLAEIIVGLRRMGRPTWEIRPVSIIEFVGGDGLENLHGEQRIVCPVNERLLVFLRRAVDVVVRRQLAPDIEQSVFAGR